MPLFGHDALGLGSPYFSVSNLLKAIPNHSIIGFFDSTWKNNFGDPYAKAKKLATSGKVVAIRVQLYWSYQHVIVPLRTLRAALPRWEQFQKDYPHVRVYLSPSCEYQFATGQSKVTKTDVQYRVDLIRKLAPSCAVVLNPLGDAAVVPRCIIERHMDSGKTGVGNIISTDGDNAFDCDFAKLVTDNPQAGAIMVWGMRYNLAQQGTEAMPDKRTAGPSFEYIKGLQALFSPCVRGKLRKPQLYKTFAEDKDGNNDKRANRPLFIIKEKVKFIQILDSNDKVLGKFPYYDTYLDQGHRYYSGSPGGMGLYAWQIAELAVKNTGSDIIKIKAGNTVYVVGSGCFRTPYYQS